MVRDGNKALSVCREPILNFGDFGMLNFKYNVLCIQRDSLELVNHSVSKGNNFPFSELDSGQATPHRNIDFVVGIICDNNIS